MKTKEEVLIKLGKQANIKLARISVDQIKKEYQQVQDARNELNGAVKKAKDTSEAFNNAGRSLGAKANGFLKNYEVFMNDVKTLGLEVPSNLTGLANVVKEDVKLSQKAFKTASAIDSASKL